MTARPSFYCWYCYGRSAAATGPCSRCRQPVQGPLDADYTDRLLWALRHPLPDRRITAVRILGARQERRAAGRLRELVGDEDPYLAAAALQALVQIVGRHCRDLAVEAARGGPVPVRHAAQRLLAQPPLSDPGSNNLSG